LSGLITFEDDDCLHGPHPTHAQAKKYMMTIELALFTQLFYSCDSPRANTEEK